MNVSLAFLSSACLGVALATVKHCWLLLNAAESIKAQVVAFVLLGIVFAVAYSAASQMLP